MTQNPAGFQKARSDPFLGGLGRVGADFAGWV
jgi:hypothetical protein